MPAVGHLSTEPGRALRRASGGSGRGGRGNGLTSQAGRRVRPRDTLCGRGVWTAPCVAGSPTAAGWAWDGQRPSLRPPRGTGATAQHGRQSPLALRCGPPPRWPWVHLDCMRGRLTDSWKPPPCGAGSGAVTAVTRRQWLHQEGGERPWRESPVTRRQNKRPPPVLGWDTPSEGRRPRPALHSRPGSRHALIWEAEPNSALLCGEADEEDEGREQGCHTGSPSTGGPAQRPAWTAVFLTRSHTHGAAIWGAPCYTGDAESVTDTRLRKPGVLTVWAAREACSPLGRNRGLWDLELAQPRDCPLHLSLLSVCQSVCLPVTHTHSRALSLTPLATSTDAAAPSAFCECTRVTARVTATTSHAP